MKLPFCKLDMVSFMGHTFIYAQSNWKERKETANNSCPWGVEMSSMEARQRRRTLHFYNCGVLNHRNV